ncbi:hypothetical protein ZPAH1_orf00405 [Aeromonas phage ZPAH1]|nr:hypothetical protein ASwh1_358 [Aeromonas phage Aswh_1]QQG34167.1 hypothetical protein ZPAH1_orf00405 [Aeromonas phage ZPAH1]
MKRLVVGVVALMLVGCIPVSGETYKDTVVVTHFVKRAKHQRIELKTSDGIVIDQYVAKRCSGCFAKAGDMFRVDVTKRVWNDGSISYEVDRYQIKDFLQK